MEGRRGKEGGEDLAIPIHICFRRPWTDNSMQMSDRLCYLTDYNSCSSVGNSYIVIGLCFLLFVLFIYDCPNWCKINDE